MNYFSHFYLLPKKHSKYHSLGCILPDLLRDSKENKVRLNQFNAQDKITFNYDIAQGMNHHFELDAKFHNSDFFINNTNSLAKKFRENESISLNRYTYFFAHILLELCIDHYLIEQNKLLLDQFYNELQSIDEQDVVDFFSTYLKQNDWELFLQKLNQFTQKQFLYEYHNVDVVIQITASIYSKVCKIDLPKTDFIRYKTIIQEEIIPLIHKKSRNLLLELKTDL